MSSSIVSTAKKKRDELLANPPAKYGSKYQGKIDDTLGALENRKYSYDFASDPVYQSHRQSYRDAGKAALADTQAAAAALSGGYGNTYAATAASLAHQDYVRGVNDIVPALESGAYQRYSADGNELLKRLGAYQTEESAAYQRYQDELSRYYDSLNYWAQIAAARQL